MLGNEELRCGPTFSRARVGGWVAGGVLKDSGGWAGMPFRRGPSHRSFGAGNKLSRNDGACPSPPSPPPHPPSHRRAKYDAYGAEALAGDQFVDTGAFFTMLFGSEKVPSAAPHVSWFEFAWPPDSIGEMLCLYFLSVGHNWASVLSPPQ